MRVFFPLNTYSTFRIYLYYVQLYAKIIKNAKIVEFSCITVHDYSPPLSIMPTWIREMGYSGARRAGQHGLTNKNIPPKKMTLPPYKGPNWWPYRALERSWVTTYIYLFFWQFLRIAIHDVLRSVWHSFRDSSQCWPTRTVQPYTLRPSPSVYPHGSTWWEWRIIAYSYTLKLLKKRISNALLFTSYKKNEKIEINNYML